MVGLGQRKGRSNTNTLSIKREMIFIYFFLPHFLSFLGKKTYNLSMSVEMKTNTHEGCA